VRLTVVAAVFPLIFVAELPDKTMFASLLLASRGRPLAVWVGASIAFAAHVVIAVSVGVAVFKLLPHRAVDGVVAAIFAVGAVLSYLSRHDEEKAEAAVQRSGWAVVGTATTVIFLAEWGDLTQILTANLAASYHDALGVGVGALAALIVVAGVAVVSGSRLIKSLPVRHVRVATAVVLLALAAYTATQAAGL
jgi:putative Ca2+/H+ antiporter (TMEM165/GDT1 family)